MGGIPTPEQPPFSPVLGQIGWRFGSNWVAFWVKLGGGGLCKLLYLNKLQGQKITNIFQYISMDIEIGALFASRPPISFPIFRAIHRTGRDEASTKKPVWRASGAAASPPPTRPRVLMAEQGQFPRLWSNKDYIIIILLLLIIYCGYSNYFVSLPPEGTGKRPAQL